MAFSSSLPSGGGRVSPPSRGNRQLASAGVIPRDKVSRIVFLSILLVIYSGITLGLILWNSQSSASAGSNPTGPDDVVGRLPDDSLSKLDPQVPAEPGTGGGSSDAAGEWGDTGRRPPLSGTAADRGGGGTGKEAVATPSPNGSSNTRRAGSGTTQHRPQAGKDDAPVHPGQVDSVGERAEEPDLDFPRGGQPGKGGGLGGILPTSPPMDEPFDVTLVSQTSQNRFWMLPFLCKRWPGPISIAILEEDRAELPSQLCGRMVISSTKAQSPEELDPVWYPVNRLRNVAVRAVSTSHFLMTDIDIWPDVNAYQALHMRYRLETERVEDAHSAIVFSAFSRRRFCEKDECLKYASDVPETITDLKPCLESNTCGRFDAANQSGQGTAYVYYWRSMLRQPNQRTLEHILCFKSHRFEPYLVVRKSSVLPMFDERFSGYGKNKIQWINHLRYSGFSFYVMPVNFVIHAPHPKSVAKTVWEKTGGGKQGKGNKIMDQTFDTFMKELRQEHGQEESTVTGLCQKDRSGKKVSRLRVPDPGKRRAGGKQGR